jgi:hypothetical protein
VRRQIRQALLGDDQVWLVARDLRARALYVLLLQLQQGRPARACEASDYLWHQNLP